MWKHTWRCLQDMTGYLQNIKGSPRAALLLMDGSLGLGV